MIATANTETKVSGVMVLRVSWQLALINLRTTL